MVQQSFEQALANLAKEIETATGMGGDGDRLGPGRFSGFRLTDDIKSQIRFAVEMIRQGKPEAEAVDNLQMARHHFVSKQKAYLRNRVLPDLGRLVASLAGGVVEKDLLEPIRVRVRELDECCRDKDIDLDKVSAAYWEIIGIAEYARTEQNSRVTKRRETKRLAEELEREQATKARCEQRERKVVEVEQKYAALLA